MLSFHKKYQVLLNVPSLARTCIGKTADPGRVWFEFLLFSTVCCLKPCTISWFRMTRFGARSLRSTLLNTFCRFVSHLPTVQGAKPRGMSREYLDSKSTMKVKVEVLLRPTYHSLLQQSWDSEGSLWGYQYGISDTILRTFRGTALLTPPNYALPTLLRFARPSGAYN